MALCLAAAASIGVLGSAPANAQVVISSQNRGVVVVNSDALDALGPAPTVPQLLDPSLMGHTPRLRPTGALAAPGDGVPRSRIYPLPPGPTASSIASPAANYVPSAPPRSSLARAPEPAPYRAAALPAATESPAASYVPSVPPPAVASPPSPQPAPVRAAATASAAPMSAPPMSAPPVSPPEMRSARAPMTASAPPPPPPLDTPAPVRTSPSPPPVAAAPPPPPAMAAAPSAPPTMAPMASTAVPAQVAAAPGVLSRVLFTTGSADLNDAGRRELAQLANKLGRDNDARIQLLAYADGTPESESQARRLSLSRALAVRSFLIEQGIRSTRVNVQALGIKVAGGPADRVDAMAVGP